MLLTTAIEALSHLIFPQLCLGCFQKECEKGEWICFECLYSLPYTNFESYRNNPVEQLFWGRTPISFASSTFYYGEKTPLQKLIHEIKYKEQEALGVWLGELMGLRLSSILLDTQVDLMLPMPLHPKKQRKRGYNQATLLCKGIKKASNISFKEDILIRNTHTSTQTKKSRIQRWENVSDVFSVADQSAILNKHILLVDDVITTGASTEACAATLLQNGAKSISLCSLAFTL